MAEKEGVNIDLGLSAKAEITTEIPSEASGRAVHALVDAISPFTETLGLIGDNIRAVRRSRATRRLQLAQQELEVERRHIRPVSETFLIPWVERTSQDPGEDGMEQIWINLLKSASSDFNPRMKAFPAILSELTGPDVRFLDSACQAAIYDDRQITFAVNRHLQLMQSSLGPVHALRIDGDRLKEALDGVSEPFFRTKSLELNGGPGGAIYTNSAFYDELGSGLSVMEKNGLLISFTEIVNQGPYRMDITYVRVTRLGFEFVEAARGTAPMAAA